VQPLSVSRSELHLSHVRDSVLIHWQRSARYCSRACPKTNWKPHREMCNNIVETRNNVHLLKLGEYDNLSKTFGKWGNRWNFILRTWARLGLALLAPNNPPGQAGKYGYDISYISRPCRSTDRHITSCVLHLSRRPNYAKTTRAFRVEP
jgi:hypothetical protein